ncbi:MAG: LLM class flavin-dependent oxidoreductase [Ilumatobacteraceae bacterium]|nr:LLM class flavin-dependent oxidoreductase [Ilumatobacteraceae bacterium]
MDVGLAIPQMARGLDRESVLKWCRAADDGPFSSISAGERITFRNLEGLTLCAAAAVATQRVRVMMNVAVLPWHSPALIAKQLATIDVLSNGRLDVAVGVGGRWQDYAAVGSSLANRHQRLDDAVHEVKRLWAQGDAADGESVGPEPLQNGGPPIYGSAMGPKSMTRVAQWATGVSGFTLLGDGREAKRQVVATNEAWQSAGRTVKPRHITGSFVALGKNAKENLRVFAYEYLEVFSPEFAKQLSESMKLCTPEALADVLVSMRDAGIDEFIVVPATSDATMANDLAQIVRDVLGRPNS